MPRYNLMHEDNQVATVIATKPDGCIVDVVSIENKELLPIGVYSDDSDIMCSNMRWWLRNRSIPTTRYRDIDLYEFFHSINMYTFEWLAIQAHCASLLDCYWIKKENEQFTWEEINFYDNPMTPYIGRKLFFEKSKGLSYHSPDCTTNGQMQKKWIQENDEYYLIKIPATYCVDSTYNELLVSELLDLLNIPHVQYGLCEGKNISKYSVPSTICKNFIAPGFEFVPASAIIREKPKDVKPYDYLIDYCNIHGCDIKSNLDQMIIIDFLIGNIDRHYGNFGIIRNAESLVITGFAPIFDNERSLTWDVNVHRNTNGLQPTNMPLDLSRIDFDTLNIFPNIIEEFLERYENNWMDRAAYNQAKENFTDRVKILG